MKNHLLDMLSNSWKNTKFSWTKGIITLHHNFNKEIKSIKVYISKIKITVKAFRKNHINNLRTGKLLEERISLSNLKILMLIQNHFIKKAQINITMNIIIENYINIRIIQNMEFSKVIKKNMILKNWTLSQKNIYIIIEIL